MKVGIIGGGIAGLTCGYKLAQRKINSIIFEKEPVIGGRLQYNMGAIGSEEVYKNTADLIRELGLEILKTPLSPTLMGALAGNRVIGTEEFKKTLESLTKEEISYYQELTNFIFSLSFDLRNPSPKLKELRKISFAEYIKGCPERIKKLCIDPRMNFTFEPDYKKIAADFALFTLRHEANLLLGKAYIFEEGLLPLTNVLTKKIKDLKGQILISTEVKKVEKKAGGFEVYYVKNGDEKKELVDQVVFATPLFITQELFPQLNLKTNIEYKEIKCIFVEGRLKYGQKLITGLKEMDRSNILGFSAIFPYGQIVIPFDNKKAVDFKTLYKKYRVILEKKLKAGWPVIPPNSEVPELKTKTEGIFLCGDFYFYPSIETAVTTAGIVVGMIG